MSRRSAKNAKTSSSVGPDGWEKLHFPTVRALIDAGESVMDGLRSIASRQGLVSKPMAIAVWHLYQSEHVTAGDLARKCGCDAGNLSAMLDRLEKAGLVERASAPHDRRVRYVRLTAKGRKIGAQVQDDYKRSAVFRVLDRLSPRERAALTGVLRRIADSDAM
ncbi:MAG TPA: MarR family transcriptional regulator [Candidatus Acidoferrales bacterium]|nr:MarR family transcriptional regulator [Candidatus Acidoferrales bacterium]